MSDKPPIFNDYDADGWRVNVNNNKSHRTADNNLRDNLRSRWSTELEHMNDVQLIDLYDQFAVSEDFGDNDARFLEWVEAYKDQP